MHTSSRMAPALATGVAAGAAGAAVMAATARLHRELHARRHGPAPADDTVVLDYDDSDHVVVAASTLLRRILGWAPRSPDGRRTLFWLVHWGYGSVAGAGHAVLHRALGGEPQAGLAFFVGSQSMALALFPVLGGTPPPWRWERRLLVTGVVQHGVYAGGVAATYARLRAR